MTDADLRQRCLAATLATLGADVETEPNLAEGMGVFVNAVLAIAEAHKAEAVDQARWKALDEVSSAVNRIPRNEATRAWLEAGITVDAHTEEKS